MQVITAQIPLLAADLLAQVLSNSSNITSINQNDIISWLEAYSEVTSSTPVELSTIRPDYEGIKLQLQTKLSQLSSWKDIIQAGIGETLLEFVATVGSYAQLSIQRSLQESMLDTAKLVSSIYTIARMLGVHISRKTPAVVSVQLSNTSTIVQITIPRYSQFSVNGVPFFNRDPIVFSDNQTTVNATLYQGIVQVNTYTSNGLPFQRFEIGNADYAVSDIDIVTINDSYYIYTVATGGIWSTASSAYVFFENTTPNGNVEVLFGNNLYGRTPIQSEVLNIIYVLTQGSLGNNTTSGLTVSVQSLNTVVPERIRAASASSVTTITSAIVSGVSGTTIGAIINGADQLDTNLYKFLAPRLYSAQNRAVTLPDHIAVGLTYPGMADIVFQNQRLLGPKNRNFINVVGITPLLKTGTAMTDAEFSDFTDWLDGYSIWRVNWLHIKPNPINVNINATLYCLQGSNLPQISTYVQYQFSTLFGVRQGSLGYSLYLSDIDNVLKANHFSLQVDYAKLISPQTDYEIGPTDFITIGSVNLNVDYSTRYYTGLSPQTLLSP